MSDEYSRKTFRVRLEHMIDTLRADIITGKRRPGDYLESERELAKLFRLSNKLVRAALQRLSEERLIEKIARVGNRVAERLPELPVTLKFGYHASLEHEADLSRLIADFQTSFPSVHVQPVPIAFDSYYETAKMYMESGLIDVVSMNVNNFHDFKTQASLDSLQPIEPYPPIFPQLEELFSVQGKPYVRPLVFSPLVLCYNRDHLIEAGIAEPFRPSSWDGLLEAAARLTVENERFGFYFFLHSKNRWPVFILQAGPEPGETEDGERLSVDRIVEGLHMCRRIIYAPNTFPTFLSGSDADAEELFMQGKVSIIMTSYMALNRLRGSDIRFDIASLPSLRTNGSILMSIGLAISAKSPYKAAARAFVDYMASADVQRTIRARTLSIPANREAAEWDGGDPDRQPAGFPLFRELLPISRPFTELRLTVREMDLILKEARLFWSKLQSEEGMRRNIAALLRR